MDLIFYVKLNTETEEQQVEEGLFCFTLYLETY